MTGCDGYAQVYHDKGPGFWPMIAGQVEQECIYLFDQPPCLFSELDKVLRVGQNRLRSIFDELNHDGSGLLECPDLAEIPRKVRG